MRRPTLIMIVVLFALIAGAAIYQIVLASGDQAPLQGPQSPGQLPSLPARGSERDESPTMILKVPVGSTHACVFVSQ